MKDLDKGKMLIEQLKRKKARLRNTETEIRKGELQGHKSRLGLREARLQRKLSRQAEQNILSAEDPRETPISRS